MVSTCFTSSRIGFREGLAQSSAPTTREKQETTAYLAWLCESSGLCKKHFVMEMTLFYLQLFSLLTESIVAPLMPCILSDRSVLAPLGDLPLFSSWEVFRKLFSLSLSKGLQATSRPVRSRPAGTRGPGVESHPSLVTARECPELLPRLSPLLAFSSS